MVFFHNIVFSTDTPDTLLPVEYSRLSATLIAPSQKPEPQVELFASVLLMMLTPLMLLFVEPRRPPKARTVPSTVLSAIRLLTMRVLVIVLPFVLRLPLGSVRPAMSTITGPTFARNTLLSMRVSSMTLPVVGDWLSNPIMLK